MTTELQSWPNIIWVKNGGDVDGGEEKRGSLPGVTLSN